MKRPFRCSAAVAGRPNEGHFVAIRMLKRAASVWKNMMTHLNDEDEEHAALLH